MFSFQCAVFSVQFKTSLHTSHDTLHTSHFTLSPTLRTGPASIARSIRLSSGSSHQYRSPGTNRGFCEADLKPSTFSPKPLASGLEPGTCPRGM